MESTIGARIKQLRKAKKLSAEEMASIADVGASAIYGLEKDANNPSFDVLQRLIGHFRDLNPDWLFLGTGPMLRDGRGLTPVVTEETQTTKGAQLRVNRDDESTDYWRGLALERLDTIDFYKELLRGAYGIRPADEEQEPAAASGGKKDLASSNAADLKETVNQIAKEFQYRIVAHQVGFVPAWMEEQELETA